MNKGLWYLLRPIIKKEATAVKTSASIAHGVIAKPHQGKNSRTLTNLLQMNLEQEIQSKFGTEYQKVVVNLVYTYNWINSILKERLDKHHITLQQFNILRILRGQYPTPATINLLKERMLDKMSDASRIVDRLVQKGLVTRETNQKDRRAVDIIISEKGLEILSKLDPVITPEEILKANIPEDDVIRLNYLLDKLRG